jgi:S1-C subfamily serine protease
VKSGSVRRAWTGLTVADASAMRAWKSQGGVAVTSVDPSGPAVKAGIERGNILVEANGRRLRNYLDWEAVKLDLHVGDAITVEVRNGRDSTSRRIVTGDLPTVTAEKYTVLESLELVNVTPAIRSERNIRSEQGVLIFKLAAEVARATGLQEGDVILAINRTPVRTAAQVQELLNVRPGEVIRVYLERDGQITFTDLVFR